MIYAIVVTYNPDIDILYAQYHSLVNQVDGIIYIDNNSAIEFKIPENNKVRIIRNTDNLGLGVAQNEGIEKAKEYGANYILLLDQDSKLPNNMVDILYTELNKIVKAGNKIAAMCPVIYSAYSKSDKPGIVSLGLNIRRKIIDGSEAVIYAIASGSLIPVSVLDVVGCMNEKMFIDGIDLEWCLRARSMGYIVYNTSKTKLVHRLGNGSNDIVLNHSIIREYYIIRNSLALICFKYVPFGFAVRKIIFSFARVLSSLFKGRFDYFKAGIRGIKDGILMKL